MTVHITHVAIRFQGQVFSLPAPNRHHHIIRHIVETTGATSVDVREDDQGFLDSLGRYVRRKPALVIARKAGQLKPEEPIRCGMLFSENLW